MAKAISDLIASANLSVTDLLLVSEDQGGGSFTSKSIPASDLDMVRGVRHYGVQAEDPSSPAPQDGDLYYNYTTYSWRYYDGGRTAWVSFSKGTVHTTTAASYTAGDNGESIVLADASSNAITVTLPPAADYANETLTVKKIDTTGNQVDIDGDGTETIDNELSKSVNVPYTSIDVVSDGSNWWII